MVAISSTFTQSNKQVIETSFADKNIGYISCLIHQFKFNEKQYELTYIVSYLSFAKEYYSNKDDNQ